MHFSSGGNGNLKKSRRQVGIGMGVGRGGNHKRPPDTQKKRQVLTAQTSENKARFMEGVKIPLHVHIGSGILTQLAFLQGVSYLCCSACHGVKACHVCVVLALQKCSPAFTGRVLLCGRLIVVYYGINCLQADLHASTSAEDEQAVCDRCPVSMVNAATTSDQ